MTESQDSFKDFGSIQSEDFRNHINKSIMGYDNLITILLSCSQYFSISKKGFLDLGCSDGHITNELAVLNPNSTVVGVDIEKNFVSEWAKYDTDNLSFYHRDVSDVEIIDQAFVSSIFTLQFTSMINRKKIIQNVYDGLEVGGGFFIAEKTLCDHAVLEDMQRSIYYQYKRNNFTSDDILDKEVNLRSIMKLITFDTLKKMLEDAGFSEIQVIWKNFGFAALICIK